MNRLNEKVAIVTGGASGIGASIVRRFLEEGAKVVVADIGAETSSDEVRNRFGDRSIFLKTDVRQGQDLDAVVQFARAKFGKLNIFVNNAGIVRSGTKIAEMPEADFDDVVAVDLKGVWLGTKFAIPALLQSGGGSIINIASIAGLRGIKCQSSYGASKGGVVQLTRHTAIEYAEQGIRVNCICPGAVLTPTFERRRAGKDAAQIEGDVAQRNPSRRVGRPDDIAHGAVWLASDESSFVTGQIIAIDGGATSSVYWFSEV
jgi:NAD(P)-dependent dehydrogenase (short-subunit alcohol dehydrogenase family)